MGAGCSTAKATKVADSIKAKDIIQLNQEAQEQLKLLKESEPLIPPGTPLKYKDLIRSKKEAIDITHKESTSENAVSVHQELWNAVELNSVELVKKYIDTYEETHNEELKEEELFDFTGNSLIHKAASLGHAEVLMLLLERTGSKPDLVNSSLATPLHLACRNNRVDCVKFLIGCGVDANMQDEHGQVPLLVCCIHGHWDLAKTILDASLSGLLPEPVDIDLKDHRGLSPLNCAAIKGDFDMVKLLVINGNSSVDQSSPKGCSPLLYAARGGYTDIVRFLVLKGASTLRQDNAGGTVLHHAIEKGHIEVLEVLQEHGFDIYSAIEIPDNAGRTAIFEAVDNLDTPEILRLLTKDRKDGGFGAKVNVLNYNGQTPLFSACREGNMEIIKVLVEECDAKLDLNGGEIFKEDAEIQEDEYETLQEKFFMEAYKNCMTPLQLATVLGYDEIMLYLIERGANPNLQTKIKGYTCLHLAVLANKPELIIELLTKTSANPYLPDFGGRTLQDMIEIFIPRFLDSFNQLLENLQYLKSKGLQESEGKEESVHQLAKIIEDPNESCTSLQPKIARHYVNVEDERSLQGVGESEKVNDIYYTKQEGEDGEPKPNNLEDKKNALINFQFTDESEIQTDPNSEINFMIEKVFGHKVAHSLNALDWKYKEIALKIIYKHTERFLDLQMNHEDEVSIDDVVTAATIAIGQTCKDKVIKVFMTSLQLLNLMISSQRIEKCQKMQVLKDKVVEHNIVLKFLQKSEEGNTRITNKIHETILDLSYNPQVGQAMTSAFILQRIQAHNRAGLTKKTHETSEETNESEVGLGSYKGLLAQLALLYKFINSFGISSKNRGPLSVKDVLKSVLPSLQHQNQDVRNAAGKVLLDLHKLSGCVNEQDLDGLNEKIKTVLIQKLKTVKVEKQLDERNSKNTFQQQEDDLELSQSIEGVGLPVVSKEQMVKDKIALITEKSQSKDWQDKEPALKEIEYLYQECNGPVEEGLLMNPEFVKTCIDLFQSSLEANNMTLYLLAIDAIQFFFAKTLHCKEVIDSIQSLIEPIILRSSDTNTRVRKKSVEVVFQVWNFKAKSHSEINVIFGKDANKAEETFTTIIANVICNSSLGEKSIIGRLGLMIKRATPIEGGKDLVLKPIQHYLGRNYEELAVFSCTWVSHKNTKIRQNALKLITEICRINCMDPRGAAFKQRIVNYILGLRANQRDPLIQIINDVCLKTIVANSSPGRAGFLEQYIDTKNLDLTSGSKARASSMDHVGAKRRLQSAQRIPNDQQLSLPQIGNVAQRETQLRGGIAQPTIVLPHSEPLTEEIKSQHSGLIDLFGLQIMTCFLSKSWSTRHAALEKIQEQMYNLDPNRRDAMQAEINRQNLPIELNFKTFLDMICEGLKDPVLKNYITLLELFQKSLPIFFRFLQPQTIQNELNKEVVEILKKTGDMKQKIREASINFCLYLSHQSSVGPEYMVEKVLLELDKIFVDKDDKDASVAQSFGNTQMISSCLSLLNQFQVQTQILHPSRDTPTLMKKFMDQINSGLRHSNPQVRKEAERLFKTLFMLYGNSLETKLVDQKPQIVQKMLQEAKQEAVSSENQSGPFSQLPHSTLPSKNIESKEMIDKNNLIRAQNQIRDQLLNQSNLKTVFEGIDQHLQALKLPNTNKKLDALHEIKKAISKKIVGVKLDQNKAREMFEPLSLLMRQLLQDDNNEVYLEALNLLKFIVTSLAPNMATFDLHLMMGSFIGSLVQNSCNGNIRVQLSSDKVIIFFAKHQNIGPFVVAKEIVKNIEKINQAIIKASQSRNEILNEKRNNLLRFYGILQLLITQFSIVLCYQQDFYKQVLEQLADSLIMAVPRTQSRDEEEIQIRQVCTQIIYGLYAIDSKVLDAAVSKLTNISQKTPLRKILIEYEQQQKQGKGYIEVNEATQNLISQPPLSEKDVMRDTALSFSSSTLRKSLFSPGSQRTRQEMEQSPGGMGSSQYEGNWGRGLQSDQTILNNTIDVGSTGGMLQKRMMSLGAKRSLQTNSTIQNENYLADHPISSLTQSTWSKNSNSTLPPLDSKNPVLNRTGVLLPNISNNDSGYTFEINRKKTREFSDQNEEVKAVHNKFNTKSTGGAGFSSSIKTAGDIPSYDPSSAKRTPRRMLGNIINNNVSKIQTTLPIPAVSQVIQKPDNDSSKLLKQEKPPLYVPTKRPDNGKQTGYVPKTGFTTDTNSNMDF